jgi:hypothetical protein
MAVLGMAVFGMPLFESLRKPFRSDCSRQRGQPPPQAQSAFLSISAGLVERILAATGLADFNA